MILNETNFLNTLVHLGYYNKLQKSRWYINNRNVVFTFVEVEKSKISVIRFGVCQFITTIFSLPPHIAEGWGELSEVCYKGINPIVRFLSQELITPKEPISFTLGWDLNLWMWRKDTSIHTSSLNCQAIELLKTLKPSGFLCHAELW